MNALAQAVPALVAILLILLGKNKKKEIMNLGIFKIGNIKWYLLAFLLPFSAIAVSYFLGAFFGLFTTQFHLDALTFIYRFFMFTFMWPLLWAIGEEIGWRGFLQPKLTSSLGLRYGIFLTGLIWAFWHYIFIYSSGYYTEGNIIINTILFTITITLMSFSIGWIRWASKSVWPCVIFHSASNAAWQMMSFQFKVESPNSIYFSGEAGIINIIFWALCLLFIYKKLRNNNLQNTSSEFYLQPY
jgi:membrane protease YdiL (CAAX protease family)